jgi:uncharacterized protein (TIGR03067 family)
MKTLIGLSAMAALAIMQTSDPAELIRLEQKRLQGKWRVIAAESKGEKVPTKELGDIVLVFADDTIETFENKKSAVKYTYRLKPDRKPKQLDFVYSIGPKKGRIDRGIYLFQGDRLTFCIQEDETRPRASEFKTDADSGLSLVVLERLKN